VVTAERDGSVGVLDQNGGPVAVRVVERTHGEHPLATVLPHLRLAELRAKLGNPGIEIELRHLPW